MEQNLKLKFELDRLYEIWQDFCEHHTFLYELTCDEYLQLLSSDIDTLEETLSRKNKIIAEINTLDDKRRETLDSVSSLIGIESPSKLQILLTELRNRNEHDFCVNLEKLNLLLVGVIQKIQEQNKKNQIFLNKAIVSLKELKNSFKGNNQYSSTYGANGLVKD